jgi:hypothetical protein
MRAWMSSRLDRYIAVVARTSLTCEMTNQFNRWCAGFVAAAVALLSGCGGVALPELFHPGPAGYQRARAIQHDPYPLDDVAEPVVGGRPREYQRPVPEAERAVQYDQRHAQAAGAAPAPVTFAPAPIGPPQPLAQPFGAPPLTTAPLTSLPLAAPPPQSYPYSAAPAPSTAPPPYPYTAPVPALVAPAPYPYGSPTPIPMTPSPVPQFRPPY